MTVTSPGLAVVTGAAGGLGAAFARQLAERGYQLFLIDRRQAELEKVCVALATQFGTQAEACAVDLCNRSEVEHLAERLAKLDVALLVNNAGYGTVDYFVDTDPKYLVGQADLHVVTPTVLCRAVLPGMHERKSGHIINVSSLGGWFNAAGNVQYGATKNFLATFSLSLDQELRGTNVRVQALCPGFVKTEFHAAECMEAYRQRKKSPAAHLWMTADEVVTYALNKLRSKQVLVIPGIGYRIVGRFAQMPFLRSFFQWVTNSPRCAVKSVPAVAPIAPAIDSPVVEFARIPTRQPSDVTV
ncbi:SDR family NAD(P)-dependent oxidoreductase [Anatilimnocola floriformis]|uniref:SDR family NAD(P)-dependent oxidoreductase n=1 Tax=Anatilimnocola floriformis TaxID=2948575 RepID=UPI0020C21188|nr:SDR family NAD(P)-dependent oxidoreductase [Anatilimnocola floriformis]